MKFITYHYYIKQLLARPQNKLKLMFCSSVKSGAINKNISTMTTQILNYWIKFRGNDNKNRIRYNQGQPLHAINFKCGHHLLVKHHEINKTFVVLCYVNLPYICYHSRYSYAITGLKRTMLTVKILQKYCF